MDSLYYFECVAKIGQYPFLLSIMSYGKSTLISIISSVYLHFWVKVDSF